jgi:hypothetical protein
LRTRSSTPSVPGRWRRGYGDSMAKLIQADAELIESMDMFRTDVLSVLNRLFLQGDDDGEISLAAFDSPPR